MNVMSLSPSRSAELARVGDAAASATWDHEIAQALWDSEDSDEARALAQAFVFPSNDHREDMPDRFGRAFFKGEDLDLRSLPDQTYDVWTAVAEHATHPRLRSQLHDLLFEARRGKGGIHGPAAAVAYLDLAELHARSDSMVDVGALRRAFELIRICKLSHLDERGVELAITAADACMDLEERKPGITLRLVQALVRHKVQDGRVDDLLERARIVYPDPWITSQTIDLQRARTTDPGARRALDRAAIQAWLDAVDSAQAMVGVAHLEQAARLARDLGHPDLLDEAISRMQGTRLEDLGLQTITSESEIDPVEVDRHIDDLLGADSWFDAAMRIAVADGPPTGDLERNRELVAALAAEFPLQALFGAVMIGPDGMSRWRADTDDEKAEHQLAQQEVLLLQVMGQITDRAFVRAGEKFGVPTEDEIMRGLEPASLLDVETRRAIARVIARFYAGDYEAAAYTGVPIVERLCRNLLLALDAPIYRVVAARAPGGYPGLGVLLAELANRGLDPSWSRFLRTFLASPSGMNFRNELLHGFLSDVMPWWSAMVLVAILYLCLLGPATQGVEDGGGRS